MTVLCWAVYDHCCCAAGCLVASINKSINLPPPVARSLLLEHAFTHRESLPVYTDGSKSDAGVGFGVVFPDFCHGGRLPSVMSIFTAELSAILYAYQNIFTLPQPTFTLFSDSCSALQALCNFNSSHPLVLAILEWLVFLGHHGRKVTFCWVPPHVGVDENERADGLAKATVSNSRPPARHHPVPAVDLRPYIDATVRSCWQDRWDAILANKLRDICQRLGLWSYSGLSRRWETALFCLRISHTLLTPGFIMERAHPPYCDDCLVPLTVRDLIVECPSLGDLPRRHLSEYRKGDGSFSLSQVLGEETCSVGGNTRV
ncbi:hypothetical protein Pcinc_010548 [Petrolisthes cinctipes]|uniref:RNase H type-1 domain-containing protein n=1 Tax=Petrolisthes cinctipes TaxID=88211 RepID=A0AAE1KUE3_PETCI|nr:hypothetical protein Pcinc_010548 [Petrolisthes cinctipes]